MLNKLQHTGSMASLHVQDEYESDGETQKLPPKLPPYKLFNEGYRCASKDCYPRPNRDPFQQKKVRVRTPWTPEVGIFFGYYQKET